jgi:phosphoglycerol transferase MdoB-like AlkP superfamily enzyme
MKFIHYRLLLKRLALIMAVYTLSRLLFYIFNYKHLAGGPLHETLSAFIYGLRFDASTVVTVNSVFIALSILPGKFMESRGYQQTLKIIYLLSNLPFVLVDLVDIEYFKFTGRRTTFGVTKLYSDIIDQTWHLLTYYWYIPAGTAIIGIAIAYLYPVLGESPTKKLRSVATVILFPLIIGIGVLIVRGSLQLKPLMPGHAFVYANQALGNLVLNTPFVLFKTMESNEMAKVEFVGSRDEMLKLIKKPALPAREPNRQNVVVIILESFGSEYMGLGNPYQGYTPFLDSLAGKGAYMKNHFANGRRSIEALPSILAGLPSLMDEPYITSPYQTNELYGMGNILRANGYSTAFFHGGRNGTMGFDLFSSLAGFERYYGLDEYPYEDISKEVGLMDDENLKGWGVADEPFLGFMADELNNLPQPFGAAVFTLSSHHPYIIPDKYKGKFPKGTLEIHETIGYTDHALRSFFAEASRQPWYNNTLFVITADHTQKIEQPAYNSELGFYDVPLIFFHPQDNLPAVDSARIAQHVDIMPSVLDYLGVQADRKQLPFGRSVFRQEEESMVLLHTYGRYRMIGDGYVLEYGLANGEANLYKFNKDPYATTPAQDEALKEEKVKELKAYLQYYINGMIDNDWYRD